MPQPVQEACGADARFDLGLRRLHRLFVAVEDVRFLGGDGPALQPLLFRHQRVRQLEPRVRRTALQRPRNEQQGVVRHEEPFERGGFRDQPQALELVGAGRFAHPDVILGEQPAGFVARIAIVAAEAGKGQFEREDGGAAPIGRPGAVGLPEITDDIRQVRRLRQRALERLCVAAVEDIRHRHHARRARRAAPGPERAAAPSGEAAAAGAIGGAVTAPRAGIITHRRPRMVTLAWVVFTATSWVRPLRSSSAGSTPSR